MAYVLVTIIALALILIATDKLNRINKAAVAMFAGVACWLLYIVEGASFVHDVHPEEFSSYLTSHGELGRSAVKQFIASHVFMKYVARCADIVLFLMATTTIVEVLNHNGCLDFIRHRLRNCSSRKFIWLSTLITFVLSANVDNLVITILLLSIVHPLLQEGKAKRLVMVNTVVAACTGGAVTVIGDMTSLKLWCDGLVTPTNYFATLILPVMACQGTVTWLISRELPERLRYSEQLPTFRGDDNLLPAWQKALMLFIGIGGLWFIPTFHRITLLPPFVGALCVLAFLWIINEVMNRKLIASDQMVRKRMPMALQYANMQNMLFFIGLMLMFGAFVESGLAQSFVAWIFSHSINLFAVNLCMGAVSALVGNLPTLVAGVDVFGMANTTVSPDSPLAAEGYFWPMLSYCASVGGLLLSTSSIAGLAVMRMERITFGWYFRHVTPKILLGFLAGFAVLTAVVLLYY